ncbi:unnamed protein product, partial [Closterium sp. NIES-54]
PVVRRPCFGSSVVARCASRLWVRCSCRSELAAEPVTPVVRAFCSGSAVCTTVGTACTWDESAVGADDDAVADKQNSGDGELGAEEGVFPDRGVTAEDDDGVGSWWRDAPREKMPIPTRLNINGTPTLPRRNSSGSCGWSWRHRAAGMHGDGREVEAVDVMVGFQANGWMEATGVIQWLDEGVVPSLKPKFDVQSRSAMLVLDSCRGHLTKEVKARFAALNIVPAVILAGCTADVQPLDMLVNKSFKTRNIEKPHPAVVLKWISRAWKAVPADLIKKAFLTCGISNALDGIEDHLVMMAHRRSQLSHEVEVDDDIQANGFWGNNATEPESDVEEEEA